MRANAAISQLLDQQRQQLVAVIHRGDDLHVRLLIDEAA